MSAQLEVFNAERTYTVEEFMNLNWPDDDKRYELVEGELIEMKGPSAAHGAVINKLYSNLIIYLETNPLGLLFTNTAFELNPKNAPLPDLGFVSEQRLATINYDNAIPGAPDLAVEVLSRTDTFFEADDKVERYLKAGTRLVWVINPRGKYVLVYRLNSPDVQLLNPKDELDGEDVIAGFKLSVSKLFDYQQSSNKGN